MKIATYRYMGTAGYDTVSDDSLDGVRDYVRTSEYVDVTFPPLAEKEVVAKQLSALDAAEAELRNKFQEALNGLDRRREELRAITYTPAS